MTTDNNSVFNGIEMKYMDAKNSMKDSLKLLHETEKIGGDTIIHISENNDKLKRISEKTDNIDGTIMSARTVLSKMFARENRLKLIMSILILILIIIIGVMCYLINQKINK